MVDSSFCQSSCCLAVLVCAEPMTTKRKKKNMKCFNDAGPPESSIIGRRQHEGLVMLSGWLSKQGKGVEAPPGAIDTAGVLGRSTPATSSQMRRVAGLRMTHYPSIFAPRSRWTAVSEVTGE